MEIALDRLITLSKLLDGETTLDLSTGSFEILGDPLGENKDTSESPMDLMLAVLPTKPLTSLCKNFPNKFPQKEISQLKKMRALLRELTHYRAMMRKNWIVHVSCHV
jgi:hypothetical protein